MPRPILGADPLRPPPGAGAEGPAEDPILAGYGPRPDATPEGEAAGVPLDPEAVTAILVGLFDGIAQLRGPHWHAEPDEFALAAPPLSRELNKPDTALAAWLARHGDAFLIILGLGAVTVPRAWLEWKVLRLRKQLAETEGAPDAPRPLYPAGPPAPWDADAWAGSPRDAAPAPAADAGPDLYAGGGEEPATAIPSDPVRLAASVGSILGS